MKKTISLKIAVLMIICVIISACGNEPASSQPTSSESAAVETASEEALPEESNDTEVEMKGEIIVGTNEVGTGGYTNVALQIEGMAEVFPDLKVKALPAGTEATRAYYARLGQALAYCGGGVDPVYCQEGVQGYSGIEWGPQKVSSIAIFPHNGFTFGVRATSDIYEPADLKGKTIAWPEGVPSSIADIQAMLLVAGLTEDDFEKYVVASSAMGYEALADGRVDACFYNVTSSKAYEQESSADGVRWLEFDHDNTEAWEKIHELGYVDFPKVCVKGAGITEDHPLKLVAGSYPHYVAWFDADEDEVYKLTKALWESRDAWAAKDEGMARDFTMEFNLSSMLGTPMPIHLGAVRYYKEIGVWTDEMEAHNNEYIAHQEELAKLWEETLSAAQEQQVKSSDFAAFWLEARKNAGFTLFN